MSQSKIDEMPDLSRAEFADAIAKGLGRALLYIKSHGLDRVKDLVLNACLHDLSYDPQCSESRSKWLFSMFANSPYYWEFRDEILTALLKEPESYNDLHQICEIVKEMALAGDLIAVEKLTERVYHYSSQPDRDDWDGANELIEIQGIDAALDLSRIFGRRLLANSDDSVPDYLRFFSNMSEESISIFDRQAKLEESIATYYKYLLDRKLDLERERAERALQPKRRITLEKIIDLARHKKHEYPSIYTRFGQKNATQEELATIFSLLKAVEIDIEDLHTIGFSIFYTSEKQVNPELVILLEWIYDRTPCSICRKDI